MVVGGDAPDPTGSTDRRLELLKCLEREEDPQSLNARLLQKHVWGLHDKHDGCPWPTIFRFARDLLVEGHGQAGGDSRIQMQILSAEIDSSMRAENLDCLLSNKPILASILDSVPDSRPHLVQQVQGLFSEIGDWISRHREEEQRKRNKHEVKLVVAGMWLFALTLLAAKAIHPASMNYLLIAGALLGSLTSVTPVREILTNLLLSR